MWVIKYRFHMCISMYNIFQGAKRRKTGLYHLWLCCFEHEWRGFEEWYGHGGRKARLSVSVHFLDLWRWTWTVYGKNLRFCYGNAGDSLNLFIKYIHFLIFFLIFLKQKSFLYTSFQICEQPVGAQADVFIASLGEKKLTQIKKFLDSTPRDEHMYFLWVKDSSCNKVFEYW